MDIALLCKAFFTIGTAINIGGVLVPSFRRQIMNYGSRSINAVQRTEETAKHTKSRLASFLDYISSFRVSHAWFTHFYVVSVVSSIFWAAQILTHGKAFNFFVFHHQTSRTAGMTVNQVFLAWSFMTMQGARRLYESITLTKPSQSTMWVGLWLVGIAYYIFISISIWIEGICEFLLLDPLPMTNSPSRIGHG
jgi:3-oxo-5-alpha-steroid 4-dehydrogenase 3